MLYNFTNNPSIDNPLVPPFTNKSEVNNLQARSVGEDPTKLKPNPTEDNRKFEVSTSNELLGIDNNPLSGKFNLDKFNKAFDLTSSTDYARQKLIDAERLNRLQANIVPPPVIPIYELPISDILVNIKNTWFELLDDLLNQRFQLDTLTKNNRMFYIGITIFVTVALLYLFVMINEPTGQSNQNIKKIYHIYPRISAS